VQNNVGLLLTKRAHLNPSLDAIVDVDKQQTFSFGALNARSCRTANALSGLGIRKGDRVALLMMNGVEFIESFFALAKIGAVVVPLNWRLVPDELGFILKDSGARALIYGAEFGGAVAELQARGPEGSAVEHWIQTGGEIPDFARDYDALQSGASESEPETGASDDDLLYIMYTSGTTGLPKGAVHTHNSAIWALVTIAATADLRFKDRYLLALPLFHVGALTPLTGSVYRGVTSIVMRSFDPVAAWELIREHEITTGLAVPAMLNFMLQVHRTGAGGEIPDRLRWIMSGAAPVPVTLIEAFAELGVEIHQVYGLTETCGPACLISPDEALTKVGSTGKAFFHTDVRVVNEAGEDVAPGEPGEVLIRGAHIMKEYWNRPDATAETLKDGWLWSGDVAIMDEDGFITIQDRTKDMIISGGENVYPAEIENVLLAHPGVAEVAVIGQPSEKWGESPLAVVVKADPGLDAGAVLDHCRGKLARFNPTGKVLKRVLRERFPGPAPD